MKKLFVLLNMLVVSSQGLANFDFQNQNIVNFGLDGKKQIALTFDDGPGPGTEKILNLLKKYKIKATFFAVGNNIKTHDALVKRILSEGHILANHTYDHSKLSKGLYSENPQLLLDEVVNTHKLILQYTPNKKIYYFRAPYSAWSKGHGDILNQDPEMKKYIGPICWDVGRSIEFDKSNKVINAGDWDCWSSKDHPEFKDPLVCAQGYLNKIDEIKGGVTLMHDIHKKTADMVEYMLPILIQKGYSFVRIDQIKELNNFITVQSSDKFQDLSSAGKYVGRCDTLRKKPIQ